jgi:hypothetical protein
MLPILGMGFTICAKLQIFYWFCVSVKVIKDLNENFELYLQIKCESICQKTLIGKENETH